MLLYLYCPVTCNLSSVVTLPNLGVPHYTGVPCRVTYPYIVGQDQALSHVLWAHQLGKSVSVLQQRVVLRELPALVAPKLS